MSCVGFEQLARRRGIRRVRLYGQLVELGVAADAPPVLLSEYPTQTRGSVGMSPRT